MSDELLELLVLAGIIAAPCAYLLGRYVEQRRNKVALTLAAEALRAAGVRLMEHSTAEDSLLAITRDQRHLLATMTSAATEVGLEGGPMTEARHRLAWAAQKASSELL
jgi:type II secretory pathway pseudopilin PulG